MDLGKIMMMLGLDASGVDKGLEHAHEAIEHFGHAMHAVEGAVSFDAIKDAFLDMTHESARAEAAQRKLEGAFQASGKAADPGAIEELAEALEKTSTFSAVTTTEAGAMLARFRVGQSDIAALLPKIQDLSTFMGTDLVGSADAMGRAIATGGEGLRALGLGFTASEKQAFQLASQEQRVQILSAKMAAFHGSAAAMAQTAAGAQKQYGNALESLHITLGKIIDKPVAKFFRAQIDSVSQLTEWFKGLDQHGRDVAAAIGSIIAIVGGGAAALAAFGGGFSMLMGILPAITGGLAALGGIVMSVMVPVIALGAAFVGLHALWTHGLDQMKGATDGWADGIKDTFKTLVDWIKSLIGPFMAKLSEGVIRVIGAIRGTSEEEIEATVKESNKAGGLMASPEENLKKTTQVVGDEAHAAFQDLGDFGKNALGSAMQFIKDKFGFDIGKKIEDAMRGLGGKAETGSKKIEGTGVQTELTSLKDLFAGKSLGLTQDFGAKAATSMAEGFGGGEAGTKQASLFLRDMQQMSGLSEEALGEVASAMAKSGKEGTEIIDAVRLYANSIREANDASIQAINKLPMSWTDIGSMLLDDFNQRDFESIGDDIKEALRTVQDKINQGAAQASQATGEAMGAIASGLGQHGQTVVTAVKQLSDGNWIGAIISILKDVLTGTVAFQAIVKLIGGIFNSLSNVLGPVLYFIEELLLVVQKLVVALGPVLTLLGKLFILLARGIAALANFFGANIPAITNDVEAFGGGLEATKSNVDQLNNSIGESSENIPEGFKVALDRFNSIIPGSGGRTGQGVVAPAQQQTGFTFKDLVSKINDFFSGINNFEMHTVPDAIKGAIGAIAAGVSALANTVGGAVSNAMAGFTTKATTALSAFATGTSSALSGMKAGVSGAWASIAGSFSSMVTSFIGQLTNAWNWVTTTLQNVFVSPLQSFFNDIKKFFQGVETKLGIKVSDALITSSGQVIQFHPDDNILAMKRMPGIPGQASVGGGVAGGAGGGGDTHVNNPIINISTAASDPKAVAKAVTDAIANLSYLRSGTRSQPNTRTQYGT